MGDKEGDNNTCRTGMTSGLCEVVWQNKSCILTLQCEIKTIHENLLSQEILKKEVCILCWRVIL